MKRYVIICIILYCYFSLTSISNLRTKQLSGSVGIGKRGHEEPDRIEHFDLELRPSKLHDLKVGEFISGGDR
jgi:hypothetical protein